MNILRKTKYLLAPFFAALAVAAVACGGSGDNTGSGAVINVAGESYDNGSFDTANHIGKPVVINFWYPTCPPCVYELPFFQQAYEEYKNRVVFVGLQGIQIDSAEEGRAFLKELGVTYPNIADEEFRGVAEFMLSGYPATIFLDKQHRQSMRIVGTVDFDQLTKILDDLLS